MTVPEAERALGFQLTGSTPLPSAWMGESFGEREQSEIDSCHYVENVKELPGVAFMVLDGKIGRIDVTGGQYRTTAGAQIGTPEAELQHLYQRIVTEQDHYTDEYNQMTVASPDKRRALGFGTDGKVVKDFRVGEPEPVGYVEGCL
jgi:hypothetical protein